MANKAAETAPIIILSHYIISKFFIIVKPIGFTWFQEEESKRKKKEGEGLGTCGKAAIGIGIGSK